MRYRDKRVLVTGGLGFIGGNLAMRLVREGARVTVVDSLELGCGGNRCNLDPVAGDVEILDCSIADSARLRPVLSRCDAIFNLAGEISHIHSMLYPERDLELNTTAQLRFLCACADVAPGVRIVYAGTRQVYGVPEYLPVDERHPVNPVDFNGVHKYAATQYHLTLRRMGRLDAVVLRLTNVYGPRMALAVPCQGFLSTYLRKALTGQALEVFGDGTQLRDPLYVDDAVEAFLIAGAASALPSRAYNVGGPDPLPIVQIAALISQAAALPAPSNRPFPDDRKAIDIGSYHTDSSRIAADLGWRPTTRFAEGIVPTLAFYREHLTNYLDPANPNPECPLEASRRTRS
jgi:UDP-glucose 4-epimerase